MKSGYKTTEFWLTTFATILGALLASGTFGTESQAAQIAGAVMAGLATLGYSKSRGDVKKGSEAKPDEG